MAGNDNDGRTFLDDFLDKAEEVVGGIEGAARRLEGVWSVDEIIDEGRKLYNVSDDGSQRIHVFDSVLAHRVADLLNKDR